MTRVTVRCCLLVLAAAGACLPQNARGGAVQAHYQKAQKALAEGRYDHAAEEFREILRLEPNRAEVHANLGTVYYAQARYAEASAAFRQALRIKPAMKGVAAFLGMSEARQGQLHEALPLLEKGFENPLNDQWKLESGLLLADGYQRNGDSSKLQAVVGILERDYPTNAEVLYLAYRVHSSLAARAVAGMVKAAPDSGRLHQVTGELLDAEGDFAGAVQQYRRALEIEPKLPGAHRALGVALMNSANDEPNRAEAQRHFEMELSSNPRDGLSEYQLGELMWVANRPDEAMKRFLRAVELQPNFPDALIAAGKVLISKAQFQQAILLLDKAVSLDPSNEVAHYRLAQALQKNGANERAAREFAEFRRLRSALESLRGIYRQVQENRITSQRVDVE